ncbi:hypothetical protein MNEG_8578 [Monoraphidium neglectum]|uniref:Protein TIC 20 n=1 Tax=Monoraphidium neglectum TaxID=145388 RepID=A0A0D2M7N5_9CHLO|nr:hypothetical protein MNEG_8578 [Monoraphidium neglectum]KIY99384.1 hypothetical protein MNEG_8578 [Monoraphidium neglectum]|eukprot:XP_013898404.1 hypothetical protein MNEG_8578 [Monoraphidium neglectum]
MGPFKGQREKVVAAAFNMQRGPDLPDRLLASLPYLLPLLDTLPYGRFIFLQYPYVARALAPLAPLNALYHLFPFFPFIVFLGVYGGIVNNTSLSRYIRYNAAQAVLLDILLIIPQVLLDAFGRPQGDGILMQLYISAANTLFLFVAISTAYGMGSCAVGQTPRLPLVADAADTQMRDGGSGW